MANPLPCYHGDDPYVFVSYAHADGDAARAEIRWLQDQGFNVWWDEGISPGATWRQELAQALRNCSAIVYLVTPNSVASEQCVREIHFGLDEYQRPVLAIHLKETRLPDVLALSLSDRQAIMKYSLSPEDYHRKLTVVIADLLSVPVPQLTQSKRRILRAKRSPVYGYLLVMLVTAVVTMLAVSWQAKAPTELALPPVAKFAVALPPGVKGHRGMDHSLAVSSDGVKIYFVGVSSNGRSRLYVRDLGSLDTNEVPGTEALRDETLNAVFVSPDNEQLLLVYDNLATGMASIKKIPATGGEPRSLKETSTRFGLRLHWADADRIFYKEGNAVYETDAGFRSLKEVVVPTDDMNIVSHPFYDSRTRILYYVRANLEGALATRIAFIEALSLDTGETRFMVDGAWPRTTSSGDLVFRLPAADTIAAARLAPDGMAILGEPVTYTEEIDFDETEYGQGFTVSDNGILVFNPKRSVQENRLHWKNRDSTTTPISLASQPIFHAAISPDQKTISFAAGPNGRDLWYYSLADGLQSKATFTNKLTFSPTWANDNVTVAYNQWTQGVPGILLIKMNGEASLLHEPGTFGFASDFSSDDKTVAISICTSIMANCNFGFLDVDSSGEPVIYGKQMFNQHSAMFSPSDSYIAYLSSEFGNNRIVIRPYPDIDRAHWQVPLDNCVWFRWTNAGEIMAQCSNDVYSIPVSTSGQQPVIDRPQKLFSLEEGGQVADATDDAQRILMIHASDFASDQVMVKTNWLKHLLQSENSD